MTNNKILGPKAGSTPYLVESRSEVTCEKHPKSPELGPNCREKGRRRSEKWLFSATSAVDMFLAKTLRAQREIVATDEQGWMQMSSGVLE